MHANPQKLKTSTYEELRKELAAVDEEMHDSIQPISFARYIQLNEYRMEISNEIKRRRQTE